MNTHSVKRMHLVHWSHHSNRIIVDHLSLVLIPTKWSGNEARFTYFPTLLSRADAAAAACSETD